jgi:ABC-type uncharacterized transport system involved in gliding motility auxiliary subunit
VALRDKAPEGVTLQPLARTSRESWVTDEKEFRSGQVQRAPADKRRAHVIAAVATIDRKAAGDAKGGGKARLVLVGDSDFATNSVVNLSGNRDLLLNTVAWLAEEESLIALRPREASRTPPMFLTAAQGTVIFWVPVIVVPMAMAFLGVAAALARRRR